MATTPPKTPPSRPKARFRLRLTAGGTVAIGPGKIDLLEAILETGSLTSAAKSIDMSYRRAWVLLDELNGALKTPAVALARGGERGGGSGGRRPMTEIVCRPIGIVHSPRLGRLPTIRSDDRMG